MKIVTAVFRELTGLFVDDGSLALAILATVVLAGVSTSLMPDVPLAAGGILLFGCLAVLITNVLRAARH